MQALDWYDDFVTVLEKLVSDQRRAGLPDRLILASELPSHMKFDLEMLSKWCVYQLIFEGFARNGSWWLEAVTVEDDVIDLGVGGVPSPVMRSETPRGDIGYSTEASAVKQFQLLRPHVSDFGRYTLAVVHDFVMHFYKLKIERSLLDPVLLTVSDVLIETDSWFSIGEREQDITRNMFRFRLLEGLVKGYWEMGHVGAGGIEIKPQVPC